MTVRWIVLRDQPGALRVRQVVVQHFYEDIHRVSVRFVDESTFLPNLPNESFAVNREQLFETREQAERVLALWTLAR